jgi:hypothetical protein
MYIAVLALCAQCKFHCHRLQTHLQYINIVSYYIWTICKVEDSCLLVCGPVDVADRLVIESDTFFSKRRTQRHIVTLHVSENLKTHG